MRPAALPLPLGEVPSAHTGRRGRFCIATALSVTCGDSSPRGRAKWGGFRSWVQFVLVHPFREVSPFLIRLACGEPPSPRGKGFGGHLHVSNRGTAGVEPRWSAGACPRPTKSTSLLSKLLSCNESGDPQRRWSTARVSGSPLSAAARRLASPFGGGAQCAHWAERAFRPPPCIEPSDPQWCAFTTSVSGSHYPQALPAVISLMFSSFPRRSQVFSLPQWGQMRPYSTVGYSRPQLLQ